MASAAQPDYEALARQFGGGRKIDYDALAQQYGGKRKVNTAEEETAAAPKSPKGFVSSVWARHPAKLFAELAASPFETAKSFLTELKRAPAEALGLPGTETDRMTQEAAAAFKRGDYKTGIIKGYASFLNFIPIGAAQALEQAAEQVNRGDVAGALGTAYGFGGPMVAAGAGGPIRPKAAAASIERGVAGGKRIAMAAPEVAAAWALRKIGVPAPIAHAAVRRAKEAIQKKAAEMAKTEEISPIQESAIKEASLLDWELLKIREAQAKQAAKAQARAEAAADARRQAEISGATESDISRLRDREVAAKASAKQAAEVQAAQEAEYTRATQADVERVKTRERIDAMLEKTQEQVAAETSLSDYQRIAMAEAESGASLLLEKISVAQAGKPFAKLTPEQQQGVRNLAERIKSPVAESTIPPARPAASPIEQAPAKAPTGEAAAPPALSIAELVEPLPPSRQLAAPPRILLTEPPSPKSSMVVSHPRPQMGVNPITGEPTIFYTGESLGDVAQMRSAFGEAVRTEPPPGPKPLRDPLAEPKAEYHKQVARITRKSLAEMLVDGNISPDDVARITPDYWKAMAERIGIPVPAPRTIKRIPAEMRALMAARNVESTLGNLPAAAERGIVRTSGTPETAATGRVREASASTAISEPLGASQAPGKDATLLVPGSEITYRVTYEVRELDEIQASHNGVTFAENPKYNLKNDSDYSVPDNRAKILNGALPKNFKPAWLITDNPDATNGPTVIEGAGNVLAGNGRKMILDRVYAQNPEGARAYRQMLQDEAPQFGVNPDTVASMRKPGLFRRIHNSELTTPSSKQDAVTLFNRTGTAALRPAEQAIADSRRVPISTLDDVAGRLERQGPDATLAQVLEGRGGGEVLNRLIDDGVIAPQERAGLAEADLLTRAGKERISKLILGRFFRDPAQLDTIPPSIRGKLERMAAPLVRAETGEFSLTPRIQEAVDLIEAARSYGQKDLDAFLKQSGLFSQQQWTAEGVQLAKMLQNRPTSELVTAVRRYVEEAEHARRIAIEGPGLFPETSKPMTPETAYRAAFGESDQGIPERGHR